MEDFEGFYDRDVGGIDDYEIAIEGDHVHKFKVLGGSPPTWLLLCEICNEQFTLTLNRPVEAPGEPNARD